MTTYATGNPVGSTSPKDLFDNAQNFDYLLVGPNQTYPDRLGVLRKSWRGMEADFLASQDNREQRFQQFLLNSGYQQIGNYGADLLVSERNQIFLKDGEFYRAAAALNLPYTTTGVWASESAKFVSVGDAALRQELARATGSQLVYFSQKGAGSVARRLSDKLGETVSVKDKDGVGDGVTDSAAALLLAGASTTGTVLIPEGSFVVNATTGNSAAIAALLGRLKIDGTLQINLASGAHNLTQPFKIFSGSLNVNGLKILGAPPVMLSVLSQVAVSGGAGNYSVTLSVSTVDGVAVGDYLHTHSVTGTGTPEVHRGVWEITAVDVSNARVTVRNTCRKASFPANTITSSTSAALKTILKFANCDGFVVTGGRLDYLDNVAIVGNADSYWSSSNVVGTEKGTHGITVGSMTIAVNGKSDNANPFGVSPGHVSCGPNVGVNGFDQQGIVTELGGTFWGDFVSTCNNKRRGLYASTASGVRAKHISSNGNYLDGVICDIGGDVYSSSFSCAVGNGSRGISAAQSGTIVFDTGVMSHNGLDGAGAVLGGTVQATSARFEFNGGAGVLGDYGSTTVVNNSYMTGNTRYGIDVGFNAASRALSCVINDNLLHGIRSTEMAVAVITGTTFSGNVLGDKTSRGDGMILDGSTYSLSDKVALAFRSIQGAAGQGIRVTSTSGGDDCIVGHDTTGSGTYAPSFHMRSTTGGFYPELDNAVILGRGGNRWSQVYAGTGTINTSDAREKTPVAALSAAEVSAAAAIGKEIGTYKWLAAVQAKGGDARSHVGMTVQRAIEIMQSFDLDPFAYGFICFDSWEAEEEQTLIDSEGVEVLIAPALAAGDRYSFRMDELNMFIAAGLESRISALEAK